MRLERGVVREAAIWVMLLVAASVAESFVNPGFEEFTFYTPYSISSYGGFWPVLQRWVEWGLLRVAIALAGLARSAGARWRVMMALAALAALVLLLGRATTFIGSHEHLRDGAIDFIAEGWLSMGPAIAVAAFVLWRVAAPVRKTSPGPSRSPLGLE